MSAHTHAPVPVDFLPLYSREMCARQLENIGSRARAIRDELATLARAVGYSPALSSQAPLGIEITFAIPEIESVCEAIERAWEIVA